MNSPLPISPICPQTLRSGDLIAVCSPAAPSTPEAMAQGVAYLEQQGYAVRVMPSALAQQHYLAGADEQRLADLHAAFADPDVKAILMARGGYGTMRLLPQIDWELIAQNPKIVIGFSDLTALLLPMFERTGLIGFHGPMLTSNLIEGDHYTQQALWEMVTGRTAMGQSIQYPRPISNRTTYHCLQVGQAEGHLIGGNLSLLCHVSGTPYQPDTREALLFIEDWRESYYTLDRQMTHLRLAGWFEEITGLILCDFTEIADEAQYAQTGYAIPELFAELTAGLTCPIGIGFSVGHGQHTATLPIGSPARFEATTGRLEILQSPVSFPA